MRLEKIKNKKISIESIEINGIKYLVGENLLGVKLTEEFYSVNYVVDKWLLEVNHFISENIVITITSYCDNNYDDIEYLYTNVVISNGTDEIEVPLENFEIKIKED